MESYVRIKFKGKKLRKLIISKEIGENDISIVTAKEFQKVDGIQNLILDVDIKSVGGMQSLKDMVNKISARKMYFFLESFSPSKFLKYGGKKLGKFACIHCS